MEPQEMAGMGDKETQENAAMGDKELQENAAIGDKELHQKTAVEDKETQENVAMGDKETQENVAMGDKETQENVAMGDKETQENVAMGDKETQENVAMGDKEIQENAAMGDKEPQENAAMGDKETQENAAIEDKEPQENAAMGDKETQENAAMGDKETQENAAMEDKEPQENAAMVDKEPQENAAAEDKVTCFRDTMSGDEPGERLTTIFLRDPDTDVSPLVTLLMQSPDFGRMSLCPCTPQYKTDWKSRVHRCSVIFLCLSPETRHLDLSDLEGFLAYCTEKHNPGNIKVLILDVEDIESERKITDWWMAWKYSDYELLAPSEAEMRLLIAHNINLLSAERRMANKVRHMHRILQEAAEKSGIQKWQLFHYKPGIFSSSAGSDYSWMTELLHSEGFKDHFSEVMKDNITDDESRRLSSESCSFGMLYYTNKKGQINEIDATDVEMIQQHGSVGMNNMIIVMDGVEDSSDQEKIRILRHQTNMEELRHNLFLISHQEKSSNYQNLLSSLLRTNKPQQPAHVPKTELRMYLGPSIRNALDKFQRSKPRDIEWSIPRDIEWSIPWSIPLNRLISSRGVLGIFSRSSKEEYSWLEAALRPRFAEVKCFYIANNRFRHFVDEVSQCRFGILYHSKNRGRLNVTDVTDSLYDDELEYMSAKLGKEKVWVVIDDLDDNSEGVKKGILRNQPKIQNLAKDLYIIKHGNTEQKVRDLERNQHLLM